MGRDAAGEDSLGSAFLTAHAVTDDREQVLRGRGVVGVDGDDREPFALVTA